MVKILFVIFLLLKTIMILSKKYRAAMDVTIYLDNKNNLNGPKIGHIIVYYLNNKIHGRASISTREFVFKGEFNGKQKFGYYLDDTPRVYYSIIINNIFLLSKNNYDSKET